MADTQADRDGTRADQMHRARVARIVLGAGTLLLLPCLLAASAESRLTLSGVVTDGITVFRVLVRAVEHSMEPETSALQEAIGITPSDKSFLQPFLQR